jgi:hypothetical protein
MIDYYYNYLLKGLPGLSHIRHLDKKDLVLIQIVVNALQFHQSRLAPNVVRIICIGSTV